MKRSELLLVGAVVAGVLLAAFALAARRYSAAAVLAATMKVEQPSSGGRVNADGARPTFAASGPSNFTISGRVSGFGLTKAAGTNNEEVSLFSQGRLVRRELSPRPAEGCVVCPSPRMAGLKFWRPTPQVSERMYWHR